MQAGTKSYKQTQIVTLCVCVRLCYLQHKDVKEWRRQLPPVCEITRFSGVSPNGHGDPITSAETDRSRPR